MRKHHFWYSREQEKIGQLFKPRASYCEVYIPGTVGFVAYTECREGKKKTSGKWKDYLYLGSVPGKDFWKSIKINGVRQGQSQQ